MDNKPLDNFVDDILKCYNDDDPRKSLIDYLENKQIGVKGNLITLKINANIKSRGRPRKTLIDNSRKNNYNNNNNNNNNISNDNNFDTQNSYIIVGKLNESSNMYHSVNGELFGCNGIECV